MIRQFFRNFISRFFRPRPKLSTLTDREKSRLPQIHLDSIIARSTRIRTPKSCG